MYSWAFSKSVHDFFEAVCTGSKLTWCMYTVKPGPAGIDVGSTGTERICAQRTAILASCVIHAIVSSLHIAAHTDRQRRLLSLLLTRSRAAASLFKHAPAPATLRTSRGPKLRLQSAWHRKYVCAISTILACKRLIFFLRAHDEDTCLLSLITVLLSPAWGMLATHMYTLECQRFASFPNY